MVYTVKKSKNFLISDSQPAAIFMARRYTNIFITLTDFNNRVIVCKTAGAAGIKGSKKRKTNPQAVETIVKSLKFYFKKYNIKKVSLNMKTKITSHAFALVRYLQFFKVKVISVKCAVAIPHSYIRGRKIRRK